MLGVYGLLKEMYFWIKFTKFFIARFITVFIVSVRCCQIFSTSIGKIVHSFLLIWCVKLTNNWVLNQAFMSLSELKTGSCLWVGNSQTFVSSLDFLPECLSSSKDSWTPGLLGWFDENDSHRLTYLNALVKVGVSVWEGLGGVSLSKEVCHWGWCWGFKNPHHLQLALFRSALCL